MKITTLLLSILLSIFLISCSNSGSNEQTNIIDFNNKKEFLGNIFKIDYQYKYNVSSKINTLTYNDYNSAKNMIIAYKYNNKN